jgi:hypothetical protein
VSGRLAKTVVSENHKTHFGPTLDSNSWYSSMKAIDTANKTDGKIKANGKYNIRVFEEVLGAKVDKKGTTWRAEVTRIHPNPVTVPPYTSYIGLDISVLVESTNKLLIYPPPFFPESREEELAKELPTHYRTNFERRSNKLLHDHMAERYRPDVEAFLKRLGISEDDVLRWHFERPLAPGFERERLRLLLTDAGAWPLQNGLNSEYSENKPSPNNLGKFVLPKLKPSTSTARAYAVLACIVINRHMDPETEFDTWEFFRRSPLLKGILKDSGNASDSVSDSGQVKASSTSTRRHHLMCRVCNL